MDNNSIVVIGTVAFDSIKTPFGDAPDVLGGSATFFAMAARLFTRVNLVAIVGKDFPENHLKLFKDNGIDLAGLVRSEGKTFRWTGEYEENMNVRHTLDTQLNVLEEFQAELPPVYRKSSYVFLANINPSLQLRVLEQLEDPKLVCCDTMNLWILSARKDLERVLEKVDFFVISEEEAQMLTKEHNIIKGARDILKMGQFSLIIKRGGYGAILFTRQGEVFAIPAFPLENVVDPTGAGDSFAGGFVGYLASQDRTDLQTVQKAMLYGNIIASFSVEGFSVNSLAPLTLETVRKRINDFIRMTHLSESVSNVE
ncbi:MAG TPA: PfkB family carbohydrate kinase [Acidobacteriota bacterium]|nr:PfkB family carbohydrate kinase [Acidobacteriota bacterium]